MEIFKYILKRIGRSLITLFIVITVVFLLMRLMPEEGYFGSGYDKLTVDQKNAILRNLGLKDPIYVQLIKFYKNLAVGNFGKSITYRPQVPVSQILAKKIPYSLAFGLGAIAIALVLGLSLGILMTQFKGRFWDNFGTCYIVLINAVPSFVYYLFIQLYATDALRLPILFDTSDPVSWILPVVSMSLGSTAGYAMWLRRFMVDELNKDYIRLARAKGLKERAIMVRHVMRNAFVPMAQYLPVSILLTISGSIYIESLYSIPGMGGLLVDTIQRQDNPLVQALVLIYSALSVLGLLLGDILMAVFDPRIKLSGRGGAR